MLNVYPNEKKNRGTRIEAFYKITGEKLFKGVKIN